MKTRLIYRRRRSGAASRRLAASTGAAADYIRWSGQKPVKAVAAASKPKGGDA